MPPTRRQRFLHHALHPDQLRLRSRVPRDGHLGPFRQARLRVRVSARALLVRRLRFPPSLPRVRLIPLVLLARVAIASLLLLPALRVHHVFVVVVVFAPRIASPLVVVLPSRLAAFAAVPRPLRARIAPARVFFRSSSIARLARPVVVVVVVAVDRASPVVVVLASVVARVHARGAEQVVHVVGLRARTPRAALALRVAIAHRASPCGAARGAFESRAPSSK